MDSRFPGPSRQKIVRRTLPAGGSYVGYNPFANADLLSRTIEVYFLFSFNRSRDFLICKLGYIIPHLDEATFNSG
jgi:hypothetical protein